MIMPGPQEWLIIILVIMLIFGASKIPELARNLGKAKGEFKKGEIEAEMEAKKLEEELKKNEEDEKKKEAVEAATL